MSSGSVELVKTPLPRARPQKVSESRRSLGVGILALLGAMIRLALPEYRRKIGEGIVFGCIFLGIGLGDQGAWIWPVLLGIVGLTILRGVFLQRR